MRATSSGLPGAGSAGPAGGNGCGGGLGTRPTDLNSSPALPSSAPMALAPLRRSFGLCTQVEKGMRNRAGHLSGFAVRGEGPGSGGSLSISRGSWGYSAAAARWGLTWLSVRSSTRPRCLACTEGGLRPGSEGGLPCCSRTMGPLLLLGPVLPEVE